MMRGLTPFLCAAAVLLAHAHAHAPAARRLSEILVPAMLDVPVAALEAKAGRALETCPLPDGRQARHYAVQGCGVTAYARGAPSKPIASPSAPMRHGCLALPRRAAATAGLMTLESLADALGPLPAPARENVRALCISDCGNAADPVVEFLWQAPGGQRSIELKLGFALASGAAAEAGEQWQQLMEAAERAEYVSLGRFNCDDRHQAEGFRLFSNVRPNEITIGRGVRNELPLYAALCR
jgi:hypothetical protein